MTANDNPILAFFAFVCLAAVIFLALKYYKQISLFILVVGGGGALLVGAIGVIAFIGLTLYEQYTAKQCLTAYERRARAREAPDDYFGRQLREAASDETKRCADIAAKREAAAQK